MESQDQDGLFSRSSWWKIPHGGIGLFRDSKRSTCVYSNSCLCHRRHRRRHHHHPIISIIILVLYCNIAMNAWWPRHQQGVLLPSHHEEINRCCVDQDTLESSSNVGVGHSRRKKTRRRKKKTRGEIEKVTIGGTHNNGVRQSHHPPTWCHVYSKSTEPSSQDTGCLY